MMADNKLEVEDLAAFSMQSLSEVEAASIRKELSESAEDRARLAHVQSLLAAYAEASIDLVPPPTGSLERLMERVALETQVIPNQKLRVVDKALTVPRRWTSVYLPWSGWVAAASLAIISGVLYRHQAALHEVLATQTALISRNSADAVEVSQERDALRMRLEDEANQIRDVSSDASRKKAEGETLRAKLADQNARLSEAAAQKSIAEDDRNRLQAEVERQTTQAAQQAAQQAGQRAQADENREILAALTDRSALRVTLTRPKSHPVPSARATYVPARGTLLLQAANLAPLKTNKVYQLWLMPADGSNPVPEGTFVPDAQGTASILYPRAPKVLDAKGFSVTIENEGGALVPTKPIILSGNAGN